MAFFFFALGLGLLALSGAALVRSTAGLALHLGVRPIAIALTVTALATSAPEAIVCIEAALAGTPDLALGNVIGSNIANVFLVLGLPALLAPLACRGVMVRRNALLGLAAVGVLIVLFWRQEMIGRGVGAAFCLIAVFWMVLSLRAARKRGAGAAGGAAAEPLALALAMLAASSFGLHFGAQWTIAGASGIARVLTLPEAVIGLSLLALGTSLPELATSLAAAAGRRGEIAIGNVLGSNILNIFGVLGLTALIAPLPAAGAFLDFDLWVMAGAALAILPFALARTSLPRVAGAGFAGLYGLYIAALYGGWFW